MWPFVCDDKIKWWKITYNGQKYKMLRQKKLMSNRQKTFAIVFIKNRIKKMEFLFHKAKTKFFLAKEQKKKRLQYENNVSIKRSKMIFKWGIAVKDNVRNVCYIFAW